MSSFSTASRQLQKAWNQLPILVIPGTDEVYGILILHLKLMKLSCHLMKLVRSCSVCYSLGLGSKLSFTIMGCLPLIFVSPVYFKLYVISRVSLIRPIPSAAAPPAGYPLKQTYNRCSLSSVTKEERGLSYSKCAQSQIKCSLMAI